MDKQTFDRLVNDSITAGASREDAESYVISGFKLPLKDGLPVFETDNANDEVKELGAETTTTPLTYSEVFDRKYRELISN